MERMGDRITGAAGPVFVTLAVVLLSTGVFSFCACFFFPFLLNHDQKN